MRNPERTLLRCTHVVFGLPLLGYIYGPPEEVVPYVSLFRYVFVPGLVLSGLWMWKRSLVQRLFSKTPNS